MIKIELLFVVVLLLSVFGCGERSQPQRTASNRRSNDINKLQGEYASLGNNWHDKRSFCLELIDDRIICRGAKLELLLAIFGGDAKVHEGSPESECMARIYFENQDTGLSNEDKKFIGIDNRGWYLEIFTDKTGEIVKYELSDLHK